MQYYKNILTRNKLLFFSGICWVSVGCKRGLNQYEYEYKNYKKNNYLYIEKITYGFYGLLIYINPVFLPWTFYKEFYRLEINLRGLEKEKETNFYNKILF